MLDNNTIRLAAREVVFEIVGAHVTDTAPLISSGRIDSLSILKLIARLEEKLQVTLPPENLQPEDFDTIEYIVETVERIGATA